MRHPHLRRLDWFRVLCRTGVMVVALMGATLWAGSEEESEPAGAEGDSGTATRVLTSVADVFQVPRDTDSLSFPVVIEGVVISTAHETPSFFLHDGQMGIHISQPKGPRFSHGDQVRVIGRSRRGRYAPSVIPQEIIRLGEGKIPEARPVTFSQVASGSMDSQWIEIEGVVSSVSYQDQHYVMLDLIQDGGRIRAMVGSPLPAEPARFIDCEVRIRGVAAGRFNRHGQMVEPALRVPGESWVSVTRPAPADPFAQPARMLSRLLEFSLDQQPQHRVRVQGTVTRRFSDTVFFIRDAGHGLKVEAIDPVVLESGDHIDAAGFPVIVNDEVVIQNAVTRLRGQGMPAEPILAKVSTLLTGSLASDLVVIEARLVDWVADGQSVTLLLESDNRIFRGELQLPAGSTWEAPEKGSILAVTGICVISELEDQWSYRPRSFNLMVASPADLRVLRLPPWWTAERLGRAFLITLVLLAAGLAWVWALRRQVQRKRSVIEFQASHAAVLEERGRIARDLHDTLEQGLTGVSLQLKAVDTDFSKHPLRAQERLNSAREMLRQSRAVARNAIGELRVETVPPRRENLTEVLGQAVDLWNRTGALAAQLHVTGKPVPLAGDGEHHMISIGTEALTNAVKHGRASSVRIDIAYGQELVTLRVADNGRGFDPSSIQPDNQQCYGLIGMRERAHEMGAGINIQSQPGQGAIISVELPMSASPPTQRGEVTARSVPVAAASPPAPKTS